MTKVLNRVVDFGLLHVLNLKVNVLGHQIQTRPFSRPDVSPHTLETNLRTLASGFGRSAAGRI